MAHNPLVSAYHCCCSARPAMNIVFTRLQPKHSFKVHMSQVENTDSQYKAALNIEESYPTHVPHITISYPPILYFSPVSLNFFGFTLFDLDRYRK